MGLPLFRQGPLSTKECRVTSKVTVEADGSLPIRVTEKTLAYPFVVSEIAHVLKPGESRVFHVHSGMDLDVHEVASTDDV
jgi:hypothetical protein